MTATITDKRDRLVESVRAYEAAITDSTSTRKRQLDARAAMFAALRQAQQSQQPEQP